MKRLFKLMAAAVIALMPAAAAAQDKNDVVLDANSVQETAAPELPDSIIQKIKDYEQQIKFLKDLNTENAGAINAKDTEIKRLKESLSEANQDKQRIIKKADKDKLDLLKELVVTASYFIYAPYDQHLVDSIAIPAYKATEGTETYNKNIKRLELLENYRGDLMQLTAFLRTIDKTMFAARPDEGSKAQKKIPELEKLDVYTRYKKYDDGTTYIDKTIAKICTILNRTDSKAYKDLKDVQLELEGLLKD